MNSDKEFKNLPLGKHTFKDIIKKNMLYVDKTEEIYKLFATGGTYFFLSRPRRFGKSLLVTTLEAIFLGEKELFKGLYIYDKIEFKKYPVIKLKMNDLRYSGTIKDFEKSLLNHLKDIYDKYEVKLETDDYVQAFKDLIHKLEKIDKVVLLIDEYDKPIIEYLNNIELAKEMRDILKNFYETIKANDEYLHFTFLTGVSKFSKMSVFSTLNNITDITTSNKHSKIIGIDEQQLYSYFEDRIKDVASKLEKTEEEMKLTLRNWYNGYSWNGKDFLYNPYSLLSFFTHESLDNYWFETGIPRFFVELIKEYQVDIKKLENAVLTKRSFDSYDIENLNIMALLFQTGFLTIKEIMVTNDEKEYVLSYPNKEVKDSFLNYVLENFSGKIIDNDISINEMVRKLKANDLNSFFNILRTIFATIAVKMQPDKKVTLYERELYYHTIFYLIFRLIGSKINAEVSTSKGFIDAVAETSTHIYIFEFKMTNAETGIKQIRDKKYYESYLAINKEIVLVGVSFDAENKNIKEFKADIFNKNQFKI